MCCAELGELEQRLGRNDPARADYDDAHLLYQEVGDRRGEADLLRALGDLDLTLPERSGALGL